MYGKGLAYTGAAGLAIGGVTVTYPWIAIWAAGVVVGGAILIRMSYRISHRSKERA